jgi:hypothetical protein
MYIKQLAETVLEFLVSQYTEDYKFFFIVEYSLGRGENFQLKIKDCDDNLIKVISNDFLRFIFSLEQDYIEERQMFTWQKELIDEIEGS